MIDGPVIVDRDNMHGRFFGDRDDIYGRIVATAPLGSSVCSHVCFIRAVMSYEYQYQCDRPRDQP